MKGLYRRICKPRPQEWAKFLKKHGGFQSIGENCNINSDANIINPYLVRIGNNVAISSAILVAHDGSIEMMNRAYNKKLDSVGPIDIKDNVFIGIGSIILQGVTIGPNAIVSAGSVVTRDVPPGAIVCGVPARKIGDISQHLEMLEKQTSNYPWKDLILQREGSFDKRMEPLLRELRKKEFWG